MSRETRPATAASQLGKRFLNRTSLNYSDVLRQVEELPTRRWTPTNGGVRGIFAGCDLAAK